MTQDGPASLNTEVQKFIRLCRDDVLPLWAGRGVDRGRGGFYEQVNFDGTPDEQALRRVRVSSRQIYAFSHASLLGWGDYRELVSWGVDYLVSTALRRDGEPGFVHLLDADGAVCDTRRDLYDHAFHILGLSWAYRATNDSQMLELAEDTLAFVDESMGAPHGGWCEGIPATMPRRQNPHMHMYEALLALYEASGDHGYLRRADEIFMLLVERFIDTKTGLLFEFFEQDLAPVNPATIEPGHMAEWCWLLHSRAALSKAEIPVLAQQLGQHADDYAFGADGFLLDAYNADGKVIVPSRRLWGQTEWLKSMFARLNNNTEMAGQASRLLHRIDDSYFDVKVPGLWMDQFDLDGRPMAEHVPASIVYHLVSAAGEAERVLTKAKDKGT